MSVRDLIAVAWACLIDGMNTDGVAKLTEELAVPFPWEETDAQREQRERAARGRENARAQKALAAQLGSTGMVVPRRPKTA